MEHFFGVWLLLLVLLSYAAGESFFTYQYPLTCAPPNTIWKDPLVSEPLPPQPILPDSFHVHIEANFLHKRMTVRAEEYVDGPGNRAVVKAIWKNSTSFIIFDNEHNQTIYVTDGNSCFVTDTAKDPNKALFSITSESGGMHLPTTDKVLHLAKSNGLTYMGKSEVRGISVDHWQSCLYWQELFSNFTLDYFFSRPDWTTPVTMPSVPVRAEINGLAAFSPNGDMQHFFHHIYEYIDFRPLTGKDNSAFEIPEGVVCKGRRKTKHIPKLPPAFSYQEEIISVQARTALKTDVWYDFNKKLVRYERPVMETHDSRIREIHDFNTGIAYVWNHQDNNCTITTITNSSFASRTASLDGKVFEMKTPAEVFYLDDTYVYSGQRKCRGMTCDVYSANINNYPLFRDDPKRYNTTVEIYFLSNDWVYPVTYPVPVFARFTVLDFQEGTFTTDYNMYNFVAEPQSTSDFDITRCYSRDQKQDIRIDFKTASKESGITRDAIVEELSHVTNLLPIRIQKPELQFETSYAYFTATLLDAPPSVGETFRPVLEMTISQALELLQDSIAESEFTIITTKNQTVIATSMSLLSKNWDLAAESHISTSGGSHSVGR